MRPDEATGWDTLLTWPVRLSMTAGLAAVGWAWASSPVGVQLGWALQYSLLVAVSITTSFWLPLLLLNLGAALVWLAISYWPHMLPPRGRHFIKWVNRQVGHIEAAATWATVAFVSSHDLALQLTGAAVVLFLGTPLLNGMARLRSAAASDSRAALHRERRWLIYLATSAGLLVLALLAPRQIMALLPLFLAILPGLGIRSLRARWSRIGKLPPRETNPEAAAAQDARELKVAQSTGWIGPATVLAAFGVIVGLSIWQRAKMTTAEGAARDGQPLPTDACVADPGGPETPTLAVFLLADSQLHDLEHARFPGQMEVASALVPVCRRPVELDMLSTAAVVRYRSVYASIQMDRAKANLPAPLWAHLGDLADLSCAGEMTRMKGLLASFAAPGLLAGIAPGNHDSAFQGNFDWSPYWDSACGAGKRLDKEASDQALGELMRSPQRPLLKVGAVTDALTTRTTANLLKSTAAARSTVTPLGTVSDGAGKSPRGVLAIFTDTTDRLATDYGVAGSFGSFSRQQREQILKQVDEVRGSAADRAVWNDPAYVIFSHVPYDELTDGGREQLANLVASLDEPRSGCEGDLCDRGRVIGLVSAHTHIAGSHRYCISQRIVREIIVGSVIDPPEQASLLEIGLDARKRLSMRLSTLPSIAREGFTCSNAYTIPAGRCRSEIAKLAGAAACHDLVSGIEGDDQGATCEALEQPLALGDQLAGIAQHGGPDDPRQLELADKKRAQALIRCLCRPPEGSEAGTPSGACAAGLASPLADGSYGPLIEELARRPDRQEELSCLAWAAAAVQAHKANGMTLSSALRCAFDDSTLAPAQVTVATLAEQPCH